MKKIDLQYICKTIANLTGTPIRIYENKKLKFFYSILNFPKDPLSPFINNVFETSKNVGYFITPYFNYYGVVNHKTTSIVLGPTRQTPMSEKNIRELAFACDVQSFEMDDFIRSMQSIIQMSLSSTLQILCTINHLLNGQTLSLEDVVIYDFEQENIKNTLENERLNKNYAQSDNSFVATHNTLALEQNLLQIVSSGNVGALCEWLKNAPSVQGGVIANDTLRQLKNTFIVTATLTSRAAIKGGLDVEDALSLSDDYIKKCEALSFVNQIINLQYHMVLDYTKRVERVRIKKDPSKLLMQVTNYVQHNLSKPLNVDEMAKSLFISRTHLATKFKKETGITLTDYVLSQKIEEAKRLLKVNTKSLTVISNYLGFSSQSHFTRTFKKYTNKTPKEFRDL